MQQNLPSRRKIAHYLKRRKLRLMQCTTLVNFQRFHCLAIFVRFGNQKILRRDEVPPFRKSENTMQIKLTNLIIVESKLRPL